MAQDGADNELDGLFNIFISDSEEGEDGGIDTSHGIASSSKKSRVHRTGQSEDAFRAVKSGYRAKVENGEVSRQTASDVMRVQVFFLFFSVLLFAIGDKQE